MSDHQEPAAPAPRNPAGPLEAVYAVIRAAGRSLDLQEVLDAATRVTVEVTAVRGCSIKLRDPDTGTLRVRSMAGIRRPEAELAIDVAENIHHRSLLEGRPVRVEENLPRDFPEVDDRTESLICVPLRGDKRVLGALCVYGEKGHPLSPEMISLLSTLGDLITLSIQNAMVYESLRRVDETRSWFLLQASHELRAPLGAVQSMADALLVGHLGALPDGARAMLERISRRVRALGDTVSDLLVLARGRSELPTRELEEVNVCALLGELLELYEAQAREKGLTLQRRCPERAVPVYGHADEMRSVLANLFSNAVKYTPSGGRIALEMREEEDRLILEVSDTGIGIPEEEQERLFQEFFRASNARSSGAAGTGLGLVIVKSAVERMGGTIEVDSGRGRGTTFRIRLKKTPGPQ